MAVTPPPQQREAEWSVLSACLSAYTPARVLGACVDAGLRPEHFYGASHGRIYACMLALHAQGAAIDTLTVMTELVRLGQIEEVGGSTYLHALAHEAAPGANVAHHAKLVIEAAHLRRVRRLAVELAAAADRLDLEEALRLGEDGLLQLRRAADGGSRILVRRGVDLAAEIDERRKAPPEEEPGIPTPFGQQKLRPGRMYVIGGWEGHGKTLLALEYARHALQAGVKVGYVSLEMPPEDLANRLVAQHGVPYRQVRTGRVSGKFDPNFKDGLRTLTQPIEVIDDEAADAAACARYQRLGGYGLLIIDHLHRFGWGERRELELEIRALTNVARTNHIPLLVLAQLRRQKQGSDQPPGSEDFRETGALMQEAWWACAIWRPHITSQDPDKHSEAVLVVTKNREGGLGQRPLRFDTTYARFEERPPAAETDLP